MDMELTKTVVLESFRAAFTLGKLRVRYGNLVLENKRIGQERKMAYRELGRAAHTNHIKLPETNMDELDMLTEKAGSLTVRLEASSNEQTQLNQDRDLAKKNLAQSKKCLVDRKNEILAGDEINDVLLQQNQQEIDTLTKEAEATHKQVNLRLSGVKRDLEEIKKELKKTDSEMGLLYIDLGQQIDRARPNHDALLSQYEQLDSLKSRADEVQAEQNKTQQRIVAAGPIARRVLYGTIAVSVLAILVIVTLFAI